MDDNMVTNINTFGDNRIYTIYVADSMKQCGHCNKYVAALWKAKTKSSPGLCRDCAMKDKANEANTAPVKPRKPIAKVSSKQAKVNAAYSVLRAQFLKDNPYCQIHVRCQGEVATDIHHTRSRGKYMLDTTTWLSSCRNCHSWVHDNDALARELGYLKSKF